LTPKREKQIIIIGTLIGLSIIVSVYLWLQNQLFPPGTQASLQRFQKMLEEPDPFWDHYRLARTHLDKGEYELSLREGEKAMEAAKLKNDLPYIRMAHRRLFDSYLAMGDVANAEKELDWLDRDVKKSSAWDKKVNAKETLGDIQMSYRRRLEELKKSQQKEQKNP